MSRSDIFGSLAIFFLIGNAAALVVVWLAHSGGMLVSGGYDAAIAYGRLAGLFLGYAIMVQFVLIARFPVLERAFGFDGMNVFHRGIGYTTAFFLVAHPLLLSIGYGAGDVIAQFFSFAEWEGVFAATIGAILMLGAGIVSMRAIRTRMTYDAWFSFHLLMYVAALFAFAHTIATGDVSSGGPLAYWLILSATAVFVFVGWRVIRPLRNFFVHDFRVARVVKESPNTYSVYITGKGMASFRFEAGQFAQFFFIRKGMWRHHPFSFSAPYNGKELRISVKNLGDYTSRISELVPGTRVIIDGPMGHFTRTTATTNTYCFIGGGVGVTPVVALARDTAHIGDNAVVFASYRTPDDAPLAEELCATGLPTHVLFSDGEGGRRIDAAYIESVCPDIRKRDVYICGPGPMMDAIEGGLQGIGVPSEQIHSERFSF